MVKPRKSDESASSLYVTDEDDSAMEVTERPEKRKRSRNNTQESSCVEEESEPTKMRKAERLDREEMERISQALSALQKKAKGSQAQKEQEEIERKAVEEQKRIREKETRKESIGDGKAEKIDKIQFWTRKIMEAVERENGGKISVRREDQSTIRKAVFEIQHEMLDLIKITIRAEDKVKLAEEEAKKSKEELKELRERYGEQGKDVRRRERGGMTAMMATQRRGVVDDDDSDSGSWQGKKVRRRRLRTYAEVSGGMNGDRIEGRVVVPGREGWKTPPLKSRGGERPLIVTSKEKRDARKLADSLAKSITVKDMGGAPQAVRTIRDGKLIIVPKDGDQKGKIMNAVKKVQGIEVRESRQAEPLLVVTGVSKGLTDDELREQIIRGLTETMNDSSVEIKIVKRVPCRNVWKENVVVRTGIEAFKELVKKGKIDIDCTLCFVEEYLGLAMCYRCCRFGHMAKVCKEREACPKCGGGHDGKDCRETKRKCINCIRMYGKTGEHSARDNDCPAMRQILARSRGNISYGR